MENMKNEEEKLKEEKERLDKEKMKIEAKRFGKRMVELREEKAKKENRKITPTIASEEIEIHVNALNNYEYDRFPQIEQLMKIQKYYNVSFDYLLGASTLQSTDKDYKTINEVIGFLDENIDYVKNLKCNDPELNYLLNCLLKEDTLFTEFLSIIKDYILKILSNSHDNTKEIRDYELFRITNVAKDMVEKLVEQNIKSTTNNKKKK